MTPEQKRGALMHLWADRLSVEDYRTPGDFTPDARTVARWIAQMIASAAPSHLK